MNIIPQSQFKGWFGKLGGSGVILQNVLTVIMPFVISGIAIFVVYHLIKAVLQKGKAENAEQRKEAITKIWGLVIAVVVVVVGPTLLLVFMNTIGETIQVTPTSDSTTESSSYLTSYGFWEILPYNLVNSFKN